MSLLERKLIPEDLDMRGKLGKNMIRQLLQELEISRFSKEKEKYLKCLLGNFKRSRETLGVPWVDVMEQVAGSNLEGTHSHGLSVEHIPPDRENTDGKFDNDLSTNNVDMFDYSNYSNNELYADLSEFTFTFPANVEKNEIVKNFDLPPTSDLPPQNSQENETEFYAINDSVEHFEKKVKQTRKRKKKIMKVVKDNSKDTSKLDLGIEAFLKFYPEMNPFDTPNITYCIATESPEERPQLQMSKRDINFFEYSFKLGKEKLDAIKGYIEGGFGTVDECLTFFYRREYKMHNNVCTINFTGNSDRKKFSKYAQCAHYTCRNYHFKAEGDLDSELIVSVFVKPFFKDTSLIYSEENNGIIHMPDTVVGGQVRSLDRKLIQSVLMNMKPYDFMKDHRRKVPNLEKAGRREDLSDEQTRVMILETKTPLKRDIDPFIDALKYRSENEEVVFIQFPLFLMMATVVNFEVFIEHCEPIVHFDATGSICRKINEAVNQIYLYALIGHHKSTKTSLPLALFLLSQHSADAIEECFTKTRRFCHENNIKWPLYKLICVDRSTAMLLAIIRFHNGFDTTLEFVNYVFDLLSKIPKDITGIEYLQRVKVIPMNCRSHFCHSIAIDGSIWFVNYIADVQEVYIDSLKAIAKMEHLDTANTFFEAFCYVFHSKNKNAKFNESLEKLNKFIKDAKQVDSKYDGYKKADNEFLKFLEKNVDNSTDCEHNSEGFEYKGREEGEYACFSHEDYENLTYQDSKYYIHFYKIFETVSDEISKFTSGIVNEYYHSKIVLHILKTYFSAPIFWSNMLGRFIQKDKSSVNNGISEQFNSFVKVVDLKNRKNLQLTDLLRHFKGILHYFPLLVLQRKFKQKCSIKGIQTERKNVSQPKKNRKIKDPLRKTRRRTIRNPKITSAAVLKKIFRNKAAQDNSAYIPRFPLKLKEGWSKVVKHPNLKAKKLPAKPLSLQEFLEMTEAVGEENTTEDLVPNISQRQETVLIEDSIINLLETKECEIENIEVDTNSEDRNQTDPTIFQNFVDMVFDKTAEGEPISRVEANNVRVEGTEEIIAQPIVSSHHLHTNGSFINRNYYITKKDFKKKHVVCYYTVMDKFYEIDNLPATFDRYLTIKQLQGLYHGNKWLSDSLIDIAAIIMWENSPNKDDVTILSCFDGTQILNNHYILLNRWPNRFNRMLLIPMVVMNNHFIVVAADLEENNFSVLDPFGPQSSYSNREAIFENFKTFISMPEVRSRYQHLRTSNQRWTLTRYLYPQQTDGFNCGPFILLYIRAVLNDINTRYLVGLPDPNSFRSTLFELLLSSSDDVSKVCLTCACKIVDNSSCIKCDSCDRYQCVGCNNSEDRIMSNDNNRCPLCKESICFCCTLIIDSESRKNCPCCKRTQCQSCHSYSSQKLNKGEACSCLEKQSSQV